MLLLKIAKLALRPLRRLVGVTILFLPLVIAARGYAALPQDDLINVRRIVPYVPTSLPLVEKMLELAKVGPEDIVYDLGSGDGRIVIMAAQKYGAQAVGFELNDELYQESTKRIVELKLEKQAKILKEDFFEADLRRATVVTLYLLTSVNEKLRPRFEAQLRPGTRLVSHDFQVPGWKVDQTVTAATDNGLSHTLYLYVRP